MWSGIRLFNAFLMLYTRKMSNTDNTFIYLKLLIKDILYRENVLMFLLQIFESKINSLIKFKDKNNF